MKIGFIGGGKMAEAIISALIGSKTVGASEIFASDLSADRRSYLKKQFGINAYSRNEVIPGMADVIFLSIKPQQFDEVAAELAGKVTGQHLVISILAGKKTSNIEALLPAARVIRVMPNMACQVTEGMSVLCCGRLATHTDKTTAVKVLESCGRVLELTEDKFDAVTALSGSGPAFFAYVLNKMVEAAVQEGLEQADALLLAEQTMRGTAKFLLEKETTPADLIKSVASAKGTTAAGLEVLDKSDIAVVLADTIKAAARRSRELAG